MMRKGLVLDDHYLKNSYKMNLQLFAQQDESDKTEKATPRKKQQARRKGQVLHSPEVNAAITLTIAFLSIKFFGGFVCNNIITFTEKIFTVYIEYNNIYNLTSLFPLFLEIGFLFLKATAPIVGTVFVAALASSYAQVGFIFTTETMKFNIEKIVNPVNGLKQIFSAKSLAKLFNSLIKIAIVITVAYMYIKGEVTTIVDIMGMGILNIINYMGAFVFNVAIRVCITFIILSIFDYLFQWWQYERDLRMSKKEVKDEHKETEGDPQIKSKIKEQQQSMSMRRMMEEVPEADVVITNPTHFAVAIKYDEAISSAPIVTAKGQDYIAQRIKEVAKENYVEIVENKQLARTLHDTVDIGESIPPELFQAVAEILAFVYSLKEQR